MKTFEVGGTNRLKRHFSVLLELNEVAILHLAGSAEHRVLQLLLRPFDERVPDVEVRQLAAPQVAAPDVVLVLPDLQGPLAAKDLASKVFGNA